MNNPPHLHQSKAKRGGTNNASATKHTQASKAPKNTRTTKQSTRAEAWAERQRTKAERQRTKAKVQPAHHLHKPPPVHLRGDELHRNNPEQGIYSTLTLPIAARPPVFEHVIHFQPLVLEDEELTPDRGTHGPLGELTPPHFDSTVTQLAVEHADASELEALSWLENIPQDIANNFRVSRATTRQIFRDAFPLLTDTYTKQLLQQRLRAIQQVQYISLQRYYGTLLHLQDLNAVCTRLNAELRARSATHPLVNSSSAGLPPPPSGPPPPADSNSSATPPTGFGWHPQTKVVRSRSPLRDATKDSVPRSILERHYRTPTDQHSDSLHSHSLSTQEAPPSTAPTGCCMRDTTRALLGYSY